MNLHKNKEKGSGTFDDPVQIIFDVYYNTETPKITGINLNGFCVSITPDRCAFSCLGGNVETIENGTIKLGSSRTMNLWKDNVANSTIKRVDNVHFCGPTGSSVYTFEDTNV